MLYLDAKGLDPGQTFQCGQCFRWQADPAGGWTGVVEGRAVRVESAPGGRLCLTGLAGPAPETEPGFWVRYLALDLDYPALLERMQAAHKGLAGCIACAPGIRVLRQPFFETLITFLISQNNNIPRITGIVDRLCRGLGRPLDGEGRFSPSPRPGGWPLWKKRTSPSCGRAGAAAISWTQPGGQPPASWTKPPSAPCPWPRPAPR